MIAVAIFLATYLVMAFGRLPGYRLDRAGAVGHPGGLQRFERVLCAADQRRG